MQPSRHHAFTLIELLIVVAIIAILAAIAVPNFLEALTRAKASRASSELGTIRTGLETYRLDHNQYPPENWIGPERVPAWGGAFVPNSVRLVRITTPIAYLNSIPADPFDPGNDPINMIGTHTYHYTSINDPTRPSEANFFLGQNEEKLRMYWMTQSYGPDHGSDGGLSDTYWQFPRYDPTNGTVSIGNILASGP